MCKLKLGCAALETVLNEAAIYADYERKDKITMDDIVRAVLHVEYGARNTYLYIETSNKEGYMKVNKINRSIDFCKNTEGEHIEGCLSDDRFNGILILQREPNSGGKPADIFWFKKVVFNEDEFLSTLKEPKDKRAATRYPKYFRICLEQLEKQGLNKNELEYSAYMNLYSYDGENKASKNYKEFLKSFDSNNERWKVIKNITLFRG